MDVIELFSVNSFLAEHDFAPPELRVLVPNVDNYRALLIQPTGDLEADSYGIRHVDQAAASVQFSGFLADAVSDRVDLAIAPEYSMPWEVLESSLMNGNGPEEGALWILGCESMTLEELRERKRLLLGKAELIFENLENSPGAFVNPVAYVFRTASLKNSSESAIVILLQFKTCPLGDDGHFEISGLIRGTRFYRFGGENQLRLVTLICSDVFAFTDGHAKEVHDRALVVHIQLNPKPRQEQFRRYRSYLLQYAGDQTEIVTLNWAENVEIDLGQGRHCWKNISGSAWYLRPSKFDSGDESLTSNHKLGMYYSWLEPDRCHALYMTYASAVFLVEATKVAHIGVVGSLSRRVGPRIREMKSWDSVANQWVCNSYADDGFYGIANEAGEAEENLKEVLKTNPFAVERIAAICSGSPITSPDWYKVTKLDSCVTDNSEVINRVTACHDTDPTANHFRRSRLRDCQRVCRLLKQQTPTSLMEFAKEFRFAWTKSNPHANAIGKGEKRATLVALSDSYSQDDALRVRDSLAEYIRRSAKTEDELLESLQRLVIWYRHSDGRDMQCEPYKYARYDQTHSDSPFDIGRQS